MLKPIVGFTGYFISDDGKVYSNIKKGHSSCRLEDELHEIKPRLTPNGYARVYMREDLTNKRKDKYIHRLVAEYFIPNPENKKYVNHKNCIRNDNRVENLEWCTAKENTEQTEKLKHVLRDEYGRYTSNFVYCGLTLE